MVDKVDVEIRKGKPVKVFDIAKISVPEAARLVGLSRQTMYTECKKYIGGSDKGGLQSFEDRGRMYTTVEYLTEWYSNRISALIDNPDLRFKQM
jgi:hypothetical protein